MNATTHAPRWVLLAVVAGLVVVAAAAYLWFGNPRALVSQAGVMQDGAHRVTPDGIAALAEQLAERLKRNPDDPRGWAMLARSYIALGRIDAAVQAYARAAKLTPEDAGVLADYADALAQAHGRKLEGEPLELVKRALELDPNHLKALALAGSAEFERKSYAAAVAYWERIVPLVSADSDLARSIQASIREARELGKLPSRPVAKAPGNSAIPGPAAAAITGRVKLAPALASKVAPGDALFIFARPADGGRMLLAVLRARAGDLPYEFRLDDSQAMTPNGRLSAQVSVVITARISKSGNAMAKPGDLQGTSKAVVPGASGLDVVIDQVRQ